MTSPNDSYLYYNININNPSSSNNNIPAEFDETRVQPILTNPSLYELSIVRFEVPTSLIPILFWPGNDVHKVSMSWNGVLAESFVSFNGNGSTPLYGKKLAIYNYQNICDAINLALFECFDDLVTAFPGPLPAPDFALYALRAPKLVFDPITQLFTFQVPFNTRTYGAEIDPIRHWSIQNPDIPNLIGVFFSQSLGDILKSFDWFTDNDPDTYYQLAIKETFNNISTDQYINTQYLMNMTQSYATLASINDFADLYFQTNKIPVGAEMLGAQTNKTISILTDFKTFSDAYDGNNIQFFATGPLRYYPLKSNHELKNMDLKIFWVDKDLNQYPLYIAPGETVSVKIQLRRKKAVILAEVMYEDDKSY